MSTSETYTQERLVAWLHGDPTRQVPIFREGDARAVPVAWCGTANCPNEGNARRFMAAWNACLGTTTDDLEAGVVVIPTNQAAKLERVIRGVANLVQSNDEDEDEDHPANSLSSSLNAIANDLARLREGEVKPDGNP